MSCISQVNCGQHDVKMVQKMPDMQELIQDGLMQLPWAKKQTGTKLLLGDNLNFHLNETVIANCETHNTRFAFLPANTTHSMQPLDVCFFRPLKQAWRKILDSFK